MPVVSFVLFGKKKSAVRIWENLVRHTLLFDQVDLYTTFPNPLPLLTKMIYPSGKPAVVAAYKIPCKSRKKMYTFLCLT